MAYDYATLVHAIKLSPSPNLAYRTAKELLEHDPETRSKLSRECLDYAWNDAKRFNQMVERLEGRLSRPPRLTADETTIDNERNLIRTSKRPHKELGRVMAQYDTNSVRSIYALIHEWIVNVEVK